MRSGITEWSMEICLPGNIDSTLGKWWRFECLWQSLGGSCRFDSEVRIGWFWVIGTLFRKASFLTFLLIQQWQTFKKTHSTFCLNKAGMSNLSKNRLRFSTTVLPECFCPCMRFFHLNCKKGERRFTFFLSDLSLKHLFIHWLIQRAAITQKIKLKGREGGASVDTGFPSQT